MGKDKLRRFAENETFPNVFQPKLGFPPVGFELKGKWNETFFKNNNPIVLELGCGRGEYTVGLAEHFPDKNFIGVDRKGARLWRGAKTAVENAMSNVAFLRVMIDQIDYYFDKDEVSEIWITFPDPQPQESLIKKRLTSPRFLDRYLNFLKPGGLIHLKTDSAPLFDYTLEIVAERNHNLKVHTHDLYTSGLANDILSIKTTYEKIFLAKGMKINYLNFTV